jgi:PD-(D/E)XK nuclease superfamily
MIELKLSPSDFAFLWEECKRCFYLKVVKGFDRPRTAFPTIFGTIDRAMTGCYDGMPSQAIATGMPDGVIRAGQRWVRSRPIDLGMGGRACCISGRLDALIEFSDGSYGVVDFKTSSVGGAHVPLYSRQLHAYAYALENPARGQPILGQVSRLGLLVFQPGGYAHQMDQTAALTGEVRFVEIPRNDAAFFDFLRQVAEVLSLSVPPEPSPSCPWCTYRRDSRESGL